MSSIACANPGCSYSFPSAEVRGGEALICPRCLHETPRPALDFQLDPPPVPLPPTSITLDPPASIPAASLYPEPGNAEQVFFLLVDGRRIGPLPKSRLLQGGLDHLSLVWHRGAKGWRPARSVPELDDLLQDVPPPPPGLDLWSAPRRLPRPETLHALYGWFFFLSLAMVACVLLLITFLVLFENARVPDFRGFWMRNRLYETLAIVAAFTGGAFAIAAAILYAVLLFQLWHVVQDGYARLSPGLAVGLLFIPLFNIVWIFFGIAELPRELNRLIQRHGYDARPASAGLTLAHCICLLIPWVNFMTLVPLGLISMAMLKNTAIDIIQARLAEDGA